MAVKIRQDFAGRTDRQFAGTNPCLYITVHETDNTSRGANAAAHARFQKNGGGGASWHYTVDDSEAVQSYPDEVRCWHAGDGSGDGNKSSIGIETCVNTDGDWAKTKQNLVELIATLMARHNIPASRVVQHNHWSGKNCPTNLRADSNRQWNEVKAALAGSTTSTGSTTTSGKLEVDGYFGPASTRRLQELLATTVDGVISGQAASSRKYHARLTSVHYGTGGSRMITALQKRLGVTADGYCGPQTITTWQKRLGVTADGYLGPATARAIQRALNSGKIW